MEIADAVAATVATVPSVYSETAVAYVDERPLTVGDVLYVDRRREPVTKPIYLGFVDCEAGKNWGHACIYVRCGVDDSTIEVTEGRFPPTVESGPRRFRACSIGKQVPAWSVLPSPES